MSELLDMIKTRRSIRKYKSDMVPKEIIDKIDRSRNLRSHRNGTAVTDHSCSYEQRSER